MKQMLGLVLLTALAVTFSGCTQQIEGENGVFSSAEACEAAGKICVVELIGGAPLGNYLEVGTIKEGTTFDYHGALEYDGNICAPGLTMVTMEGVDCLCATCMNCSMGGCD